MQQTQSDGCPQQAVQCGREDYVLFLTNASISPRPSKVLPEALHFLFRKHRRSTVSFDEDHPAPAHFSSAQV